MLIREKYLSKIECEQPEPGDQAGVGVSFDLRDRKDCPFG